VTTNGTKPAKDGEAALQQIVGARLTSVQFVLNYLILGFDERGALTTLVWPTMVDRASRRHFGAAGYRDALCDLITEVVENVRIGEDETITIAFPDGRE
jgi:hypothetical protein